MKRDIKLLLGVLLLAIGIISVSISLGMQSKNTPQSTIKNEERASTASQVKQAEGSSKPSISQPTTTTTSGSSSITINDLAKHNQMDNCWVAYQGKVYDMTDWLPRHPGSAEAILPYCGTSGGFENAFNRQHGAKRASWIMQVATFMGYFEDKGVLAK